MRLCKRCAQRTIANSKKKIKFAKGKCHICRGALFGKAQWTADIIDRNSKEIEFSNFLIGTMVDKGIIEREKALWEKLGIKEGRTAKQELNALAGTILEKKWAKPAEFEKPDILFIVDTNSGRVEKHVSPLYVYGKYRKLSRKIPQTRWLCRECWGRGCERCEWTGKMYQESVEEFIGAPAKKAAQAKNYKLHGSGREDIDARMLGQGRPFVLELIEPKARGISLPEIEKQINAGARRKVSVSCLSFAEKNDIERLKSAKFDKKYFVVARANRKITKADIKKIKSLAGALLLQKTPARVLHRRADKLRKRRIKGLEAKLKGARGIELTIKAEAGTYIKEFITGDGGRTAPSISAALNCIVKPLKLDVIEIETEAKNEAEAEIKKKQK